MSEVPESPDGYGPYRRSNFPPAIIGYLSHAITAVFTIIAVVYFQPDKVIESMTAVGFGIGANLYFHESIHYIVQSRLGYEPKFEFPNKVWVPNVALGVNDGLISLLSPQVLSLVYLGILLISDVFFIDFMIVLALIFNLAGGIQDITWAIRRLIWPSGNLVFVDLDGNEYVAFPKQ